MDFVSAKSSFFTMTCWFPVSARISLAAASAFAMSLQAIMTLAPARGGGESRTEAEITGSTLGDQGYDKQADYAQCLQTTYCFIRELASSQGSSWEGQRLSCYVVSSDTAQSCFQTRKTHISSASVQVLPGQECVPQHWYD